MDMSTAVREGIVTLELFEPNIGIARSLASWFWMEGAEREDVEQEALCALWIASRDYNASTGVPFPAFARIVIRRRLSTAVKSAQRMKNAPLNDSQRVVVDSDGELGEAVVLAPDPNGDACDAACRREHVMSVLRCLATELTENEREAVLHLANGYGVTSKRIDNAAHRGRVKLRRAGA